MDGMEKQAIAAIEEATIIGNNRDPLVAVDTKSKYYQGQLAIMSTKWRSKSYSARETAFNTARANMAKYTVQYKTLQNDIKKQAVHMVTF
jgi:hypothetical protein